MAEEIDTVLDAHQRRQANWFKDAEEIFPEKTAEEKKRIKLLDDLSAMDAQRLREQREAEAAKAEAEKQANKDQRLAEIDARRKELDEEAKALKAEAAELKPEPQKKK